MKIELAIFKHSMPLGGAETLILQHLDHIDRSKFSVHFITQTKKGRLLASAKEKSDYYYCLRRRSVLDLISILRLRKYLVEKSIDIVHSHDWISTLYLLIASRGLNVKIFNTTHAQDQSWRNYVNLKILKKCDVNVICVSKSQRIDLFARGILWQNMSVVHNCYDTTTFKKSIKPVYFENKGTFKVVMVGNYYWQKDQKTLIEATNIINKEGYKIELHLVGSSNTIRSKQLRLLAKNLSMDSFIHFHDDIIVNSDFLSQFHLFVFSSKSETFGIVTIEAMASGLPVLVSDIPPNMEIIRFGSNGLYFETGNQYKCAEKMLSIIKNPQLQKTFENKSYERAEDFSPEIVVRQLENQYLSQLDYDYSMNANVNVG
ncbi:MAG: glycosyltransferase family 4 protein [Candidatus Scalindua sp.]|nr:glycosyltransferase family 4 protein [Candidatus Scalindua sp.]